MAMLSMVLYLIRIIILGLAIGTAFIRLKLFNKLTDGQTLLLGIASTPMFVSLIDYLLGLIFIGWGSWFYFLIPTIFSLVFLFLKRNYQITLDACVVIGAYLVSYIKSMREWIVLDSIVAVGIMMFYSIIFNGINPFFYVSEIYHTQNVVGLLTAVIFISLIIVATLILLRKMYRQGTLKKNIYFIVMLVVIGTATIHAMSMIERPRIDSDRAHYELNARYFLEDKNSWEVDNYSDEKYGSSLTDDHGPLWVMYLVDADIVADIVGMDDQLKCVNFALFWAYLCFYYFIFISASFVGGTYRTGAISLVLFNIYVYTILEIIGSRDAFRFVGLMLLFMYVVNQFDGIAEGECFWYNYLIMFLFCFLSMNGHEGNVYIMLGMFMVLAILLLIRKTPLKHFFACGISVLLGTLLGITKTIRIYLTTGRMTSSTILPFHDTPVVEQITKLNENRADFSRILNTYTYSVRFMIILGIIGLIVMLVLSILRDEKEQLIAALTIVGMLLPMTGIMNWIGYDVSLWFAEQLRYRMYFIMLFAITGAWLITRKSKYKSMTYISSIVCIICFIFFLRAEFTRYNIYCKSYVKSCIDIRKNYEKMADIISSVTDEDAFTKDQLLLYYLHGNPKLLYHPYTEDLIQAKTDNEIEAAIEKLNVGVIILPEDGIDYHDYSLLPFWEYINQNYSKITPEEGGYSSDNIIFYRRN